MEKMNYTLSPEGIRYTLGSSKGTQIKYFENNWWYKRNMMGYEGLAEKIVSDILSCSNIKNYVTYEECCINGVSGCRSENFLKENEQNISFQRAYEMYFNNQLSEQIRYYDKPLDRLNFVLEFFDKYYNLDVEDYLSNILYLDMLTLNTDRHFNNLSIILGSDNNYKIAPVFDNGAALFSNYQMFPMENDIIDNLERVVGQPFSVNLETQAMLLECNIKLDYDKLYEKIEPYRDTRAYKTLDYQLKKYQDLFLDKELEKDTDLGDDFEDDFEL